MAKALEMWVLSDTMLPEVQLQIEFVDSDVILKQAAINLMDRATEIAQTVGGTVIPKEPRQCTNKPTLCFTIAFKNNESKGRFIWEVKYLK